MKRQKDLFGFVPPEPVKLPTLILHQPDLKQWQKTEDFLNSHCTKEELLKYADALSVWLSNYEVMRATSDGDAVRAFEIDDMTKTSTAKINIAKAIALVLGDQKNMTDYLATLSQPMLQLWRTVLLNIFVSQETAKQILQDNSEIFKEERVSYYRSNTVWERKEFKWFTMARCLSPNYLIRYYREYETYISIKNSIHSIFLPYICPEAFEQAEPVSGLPDSHWRFVELEADSHSHFQLFLSLMTQNELPVKKKGVGVTEMKRAQKKMALTELYPGDGNVYRQNVRAYSYLQLLTIHETYLSSGEKRSYQDTLRNLFSKFKPITYFITYLLYPHVKGLTRQFTEYGYEAKLFQMLINWLHEVPEGWVCLHDVIGRIYAINNDPNSSHFIPLVYNPNNEDYANELINEYSNAKISADSYVMQFGYGGLQMCALLLASLGMAEVAFNEDNPCRSLPFENVEYMRLTPLGRYALNITNEYEAPKQQQQAYFELDPDRLIIRSLVTPNPYAQLLKDTSHPISRNRFETSAQSFLANCHDRSDVESKISIFKEFIADELPPLWEQFFQQLLQHCNPLKEDLNNYRHYILDAKNTNLIQLITNDPVLRQLVTRAEGYRILVKSEDVRKLETGLKKHGYLL